MSTYGLDPATGHAYHCNGYHPMDAPCNTYGKGGPAPMRYLLAEIEKGQMLGGHTPSDEAMQMAAQVIDGTLDAEAARALLLQRYQQATPESGEAEGAPRDTTSTETHWQPGHYMHDDGVWRAAVPGD